MSTNRRGGIIYLFIDGTLQEAVGEFTYDLGEPQRTAIVGSSGVNGYSETVKPPFIEGAITDANTLDLSVLTTLTDVDITLELANGKTLQMSKAWYAGSGSVTTNEGEIEIRFESRAKMQEIK